jgi:hypothetical protein
MCINKVAKVGNKLLLNLLVCEFSTYTLSLQWHVASRREHPNSMFSASLAYYERAERLQQSHDSVNILEAM